MSDYTIVDAQRNQIGPIPESEVRNLPAQGVMAWPVYTAACSFAYEDIFNPGKNSSPS